MTAWAVAYVAVMLAVACWPTRGEIKRWRSRRHRRPVLPVGSYLLTIPGGALLESSFTIEPSKEVTR